MKYQVLFSLKNKDSHEISSLIFSEKTTRIRISYQVLFSLKNNEKIFKTVICCSHDWPLRIISRIRNVIYFAINAMSASV